MKRATFNRLIAGGAFAELFITEMAWNNPSGTTLLPPVDIDGTVYRPRAVADRSGFKVLVCDVDAVPSPSACRRIDLKVRKFANDYILIFARRDALHHLWMTPVRRVDKRDIVTTEYTTADQAEFLYQKVDTLSFGFAETVTIVDVRERVQETFAVNSERITKDFYTGFRKEHKAFVEFITGIEGTETAVQDRQWYASVMLNRLMFCYFVQKKGFLDGDTDYLQNKLRLVRRERGEGHFFRSFYLGFLRGLFHDGLNAPRHDADFENFYGRIPYLNGGMFDEHKIERDYADIDIADEAFEHLFDFFDRWNWHLDTRITAKGRDINPDVLGYIFEQYINDRAKMGAYYTKEDITEYIGRNCILPFLFDSVRTATADAAHYFAPDGFVWQSLRRSGDRYVFDAVKKGFGVFDRIPANIARGIITPCMHKEYAETPVGDLPADHVPLAELRADWNSRTPEPWGLPNEIWRETIDRLQRCADILERIREGKIVSVNDFITYNLDIRTFAADLLAEADSRFVGWFYHALQKVTVLDPTCGSGAFLFAAMNILEPLYEICIDRMQEFNHSNPALFKAELAEITDKYRSNIQYFIYKSIILRNLYGVDIMVEAVEIAKLRLFLKMVAAVDVDRRADNLGLDPLPDIDFNIRCGNSLVGYANKAQLEADLNDNHGSLEVGEANKMLKASIQEELQKVATAGEIFKVVQLRQDEDIVEFKKAKNDLRLRLQALNDKLNRRQYLGVNGMSVALGDDFTATEQYRQWLTSHQPFNWLAEFYQIIEGKGGFDVIIGNPPYVVYKEGNYTYKISGYETIESSNLYAYCMERAFQMLNHAGEASMIVPISFVNGPKFSYLRHLLSQNITHISCYSGDTNPGVMFPGVRQNVCIVIINKRNIGKTYITDYIRFYNSERPQLFTTIKYCHTHLDDYGYFKMGREIQNRLKNKIIGKLISSFYYLECDNCIYKKTTSGSQYKLFFKDAPFFSIDGVVQTASSFKPMYFNRKELNAWIALSIYNSNLFNYWWVALSDGRNVTNKEVDSILLPQSLHTEELLVELAKALMEDLQQNSTIVTYNKAKGVTSYAQFIPRLSKHIIDEIDGVLARHYGFTEEELDFIINYDIKYRMGDELNGDE